MSAAQRPRDTEFDLVLFGATGFTGHLVAEYLVDKKAAAGASPVRWALGGRSARKLEEVRAGLAALDPAAADLPIVIADSADRAALDAMARRTRVVCSTVGPYAQHGSELVAACAATGTHYCDLTGEVDWVRAMIDANHARAVETGARIVHCCGFDSIPSDLGVFVLGEHFAKAGKRLHRARYLLGSSRGGTSGGTLASAMLMGERARNRAVRRILVDPYCLCPDGERSGPDRLEQTGVRRDPFTGTWTGPFVMATVNARVVRRSNALLGYPWGRDFRYDEAVDLGPGPRGFVAANGLTAAVGGMLAVTASAPLRAVARRLLPAPGEGPSRQTMERGRFRVTIHGEAEDGSRARVRVAADRDPGYGATARMLGESALCLAQDDAALASHGGLLTPASAMGRKLVDRLIAAEIRFSVEE